MSDPLIRNPLALGDDALGENPGPVEVPAEVLAKWTSTGEVIHECGFLHPSTQPCPPVSQADGYDGYDPENIEG